MRWPTYKNAQYSKDEKKTINFVMFENSYFFNGNLV